LGGVSLEGKKGTKGERKSVRFKFHSSGKKLFQHFLRGVKNEKSTAKPQQKKEKKGRPQKGRGSWRRIKKHRKESREILG